MVLKPQVSAFLEVVRGGGSPDLRLEQIEVRKGSRACGHSIRKLRIQERTGALLVADRRPGGAFDTRPGPETTLGEGDVLIGVGAPAEIHALEDLSGVQERSG